MREKIHKQNKNIFFLITKGGRERRRERAKEGENDGGRERRREGAKEGESDKGRERRRERPMKRESDEGRERRRKRAMKGESDEGREREAGSQRAAWRRRRQRLQVGFRIRFLL